MLYKSQIFNFSFIVTIYIKILNVYF